ncbi:hypothetical protein [Listeria rocourtiae]|uniref:hypothetical protein n=1 Tax=Listeria rocourtiae TaxID=647910 RepID=UPI0003E84B38|nr:hypothetical protein [Listeria rocourtiae]EUJ44399.1 hypothetical protein PROCOU_13888 [Listeria rocourtiae FSL F6-920]
MSEEVKTETTVGNPPDGAKNTEEPTQEQTTQTVPYDRFKEINDAKKAKETELEQLKAQIAAKEAKEAEEAGQFKALWEQEKNRARSGRTSSKTHSARFLQRGRVSEGRLHRRTTCNG